MWGVTGALVILLVSLWVLWRKRKFSVFKSLNIPGPEPHFIFGNLLELNQKGQLKCMEDWIEKYGKVIGYYNGLTPVLLVADVELLKQIQIRDFQSFVNRSQIYNVSRAKKDSLQQQLTNLKDRRWKDIRSLVTPTFTTSKLKQMTPLINTAIDDFMDNIEIAESKKKSFDIYQLFKMLTMDVIGRTAFGVQTNVQKDPNDPFLLSAKSIFSVESKSIIIMLSFSFPELRYLFIFLRRILMRWRNKGRSPLKHLDSETRKIVRRRRENPSHRRQDLLQLMIDVEMTETDLRNMTDKDLTAGDENDKQEETKTTTGSKSAAARHMTDEEIIQNSLLFFLAGYETTSTALAFTTHMLLQNPEVQEKVRNEVNELLEKEGELNYASVQKLQYLDQVFNESLRVYPPIILFVTREANRDIQYGDILIKKGMSVQAPVYALHHDPELWENPYEFDPDRFSPENKSKINPMAFQPFGAGPRNCIGMRFAQMEAKMAIAKLLHKYKLVACEETEKDPIKLKISNAIITPKKGIILKVEAC